MAQLNLSHTLVAGTPENINDVQDNFQDVVDHVNNALIGDDNLTSPNNALWRPIFRVHSWIDNGVNSIRAMLEAQQATSGIDANKMNAPIWIPDTADVAVAGRTANLRVVSHLITNDVAPGISFTVTLAAISAITGSPAGIIFTPTPVGNTTVHTTPAASSMSRVESTAFDYSTLAATGHCFAVTPSGNQHASNVTAITAQLEMRHT